jgi:hypothetical protein
MNTSVRVEEGGFSKDAEVVTDTLMVDLVSEKWRLFEYHQVSLGGSRPTIRKGKVVRRRDSQATLQNRGKPARFESKQEAIGNANRFLKSPSRA